MNTVEPRPYRWTRDEYYKLCEADWFQDRRVQLIDGEVIQMSAQKNEHGISIDNTRDPLVAIFGPNFWVRTQMCLDLSPYSVPDPDLAVVPGPRSSYAGKSVPTSALLVVEVSETTLWYDRNRKANLYAAAGISDYWIINLVDRQVEVYRDPVADPSAPFGYRYASRTILDPGDTVSPLALPTATVAVADLLP
jgi:Uma2 family endonuclease